MKKPSMQFVFLFIAFLTVSFESFAQRYPERRPRTEHDTDSYGRNETYQESIQQTLQEGQSARLSNLLRISGPEVREMDVISLSFTAQSFNGPAELYLYSNGQFLQTLQVSRNLRQIRAYLPANVPLNGLVISVSEEVFLDSVYVEVRKKEINRHDRYDRQVVAGSFLKLNVYQNINGQGQIELQRLINQQLGLSLEGAEILKITVEGRPQGLVPVLLQAELNNRTIGKPKLFHIAKSRVHLNVGSREEVDSLRINVVGDIQITRVIISIGQVRHSRID